MATLYDIKPRFQALLRPGVGAIARRGVTPNHLTGLALAISVLAGGLMALMPGNVGLLALLAAVLFARMALNAMDGMLAREHGLATRLGAVFNEIADVASDAALYLGLAVALTPFGVAPASVIAFAVAGLIAEFAGVLAPSVGAARRYDGPMGKSDRALVAGVLAVWVAAGLPIFDGMLPTLAFTAAAALGLWTSAKRIRAALAEGAAP